MNALLTFCLIFLVLRGALWSHGRFSPDLFLARTFDLSLDVVLPFKVDSKFKIKHLLRTCQLIALEASLFSSLFS